jgi:hypothetical protein
MKPPGLKSILGHRQSTLLLLPQKNTLGCRGRTQSQETLPGRLKMFPRGTAWQSSPQTCSSSPGDKQ